MIVNVVRKKCVWGKFTKSPKVIQDGVNVTEDECCLLPYCKIELCDVPKQKLKKRVLEERQRRMLSKFTNLSKFPFLWICWRGKEK